MRQILEGMHRMMQGDSDSKLYPDVVKCFEKFDRDLLPTQESAWSAFLKYSSEGGYDEWLTEKGEEYDPWMQCHNETRNCSVRVHLDYVTNRHN